MRVGCLFITCAVKKKGIQFCWQCFENETCKKWHNHIEFSKDHDTFVCYQKLEDNLSYIQENNVPTFEVMQKIREALLVDMLENFNEGRSKSYYCICATMLKVIGSRTDPGKERFYEVGY